MKSLNALPFNSGATATFGNGTYYPIGYADFNDAVQLYWSVKNLQITLDFSVELTVTGPAVLASDLIPSGDETVDCRVGATSQSDVVCETAIEGTQIFGPLTYDPNPGGFDDDATAYVGIFIDSGGDGRIAKNGGLWYPGFYFDVSAYSLTVSTLIGNDPNTTYYIAGTVTFDGHAINLYYGIPNSASYTVSAAINATIGIDSTLTP